MKNNHSPVKSYLQKSRGWLLGAFAFAPTFALAALGASVTLAGPDPIYPGEVTNLQIQLSNSALTPIASASFPNQSPFVLPGSLPNGLRVAGAPTYTCTNPNGGTVNPGAGTLSAAIGGQSITLSGGGIPASFGGTDGTCLISVPVTAGTSNGSAASYAYTISNGSVTGTDGGGPVSNAGAVTQSIGVRAMARPVLTKSFSSGFAHFMGPARALTLTLSNPSPVALPNFSINDVFPIGSDTVPLLRIASPPNATSTCVSGTAATFNAVAGAFGINATGGTVGPNSTCTMTVDVVVNSTNGAYAGGATNYINVGSQFNNDIGILPLNDAAAGMSIFSPIHVAKSFSSPSLSSGQSGSLSIELRNEGISPLTVTTFDDDAIDGMGAGNTNPYGLKVTGQSTTCAGGSVSALGNTGVRLTGGTLPGGGTCYINVTFVATVQTPGVPISYTNSIPYGMVGFVEPGVVSKNATSSILVGDDLRVQKAASPSNPAPGNPVRYEVTVENFTTSIRNNVAISDTFANGQTLLTGVIAGTDFTPTVTGSLGCGPVSTTAGATGSGAVTLTLAAIPPRGSAEWPSYCVVRFWAMTNPAALSGAPVTNSIASGAVTYPGNPNTVPGASSPGGSISRPIMSVAKSFSPAGPLSEGSITRLTFVLTNSSSNPLTNTTISDNLPTNGGIGQMRVANPANAATTCGSGVVTANPGDTSITMNGGVVPARAGAGLGVDGTCQIQVDVIAPAGIFNNTVSAAGTQTLANGATQPADPVTGAASITFTSALSGLKSFNPSTVSSGGKSTVTVRVSNSGAAVLTNLAITDPLPSGMVLDNPTGAYSTCAGPVVIAGSPGASSINLSGASLAGGGNCDLVFDVVATGGASWVNTIPPGNIAANGGVINTTPVSSTLNFAPPSQLTVAKATNPSTLTFPGQFSRMTVTITAGSTNVSNMALTDYFTNDGTSTGALNGMIVADVPAGSTTCPGGSVSGAPGATSFTLTNASLATGLSCTMAINVTSVTVGGITNLIPAGSITTDQGLSNFAPAATSLSTQSNVGITKTFTPNVVKPGERTRLRINFFNATALPLANVSVLDTFPAGLTVPGGPNPTSTCIGATVTSPASNQVQISGASVPASSGPVSASCYSEIDVLVAAQGDYVNTIPAGAVTGTSGGVPLTNAQPTSDTVRAKIPAVINKAIATRTLDAGNPAGFTTGFASRTPGAAATMTIRVTNPNAVALTAAQFTDSLPSGLVVATPANASTTCVGGVVLANAADIQVRLASATIPANGFCTVSVDVLSNISGSYVNTIASSALTTAEGVSNEESTSARLLVSTPPSITKQFSPPVIAPGGVSTLTIFLGNTNSTAATLTSVFTDTLPTAPGNVVVAPIPNKQTTCTGGAANVSANAGAASVSYASGQQVQAGGCTITVDVTATAAGVHTNNIPAGALQTSFGFNQAPASATLTVSTMGFIAGKVFSDGNVVPNGTYQAGIDSPIPSVTIELRSGASCAGALLSSTTSDASGNYLFASLTAGTYSVCEPIQPSGTVNGATAAGSISAINGSTGTAGTPSNPTALTSQITGIVLNADGLGGEISGSPNNNFPEIILSSISGRVFLDQNNSGTQNGTDAAIAGVSIELLDNLGAVVATVNTDVNGDYAFTGLQPGTYSVREPTQPAATSNGITTPGSVANGGIAGSATTPAVVPSRISNIVLPPNTVSAANNFAEIPNGRTVSGRVFMDYDNNGTFEAGDNGLPTQTVNLTGLDVNGNPVSMTVVTGADGRYSFTGVPEGTSYSVTQPAQPASTTNGITSAGTTGGTATGIPTTPSAITGINLAGINMVSGENNFAEIPGASPDLTISKTHTPGSFAQGSNTGIYTLTVSNIAAVASSGTVTVVDTLPAGMSFVSATGAGWTCSALAQDITCTSTGVVPANGSGVPILIRVAVANGLAGQILINTAVVGGGGEPPPFTGNNTDTDPTPIDVAASVSGSVWRDDDHDRVKDAAEQIVPGWSVEILNNGNIVATTTTDAAGTYAFNNLAPGAGYQVRFREPVGGSVYGRPVPNESGIAYTNGVESGTTDTMTGVRSGGNPAGATNTDGTLSGLTLVAGTNTIEQSLPLDPAGVVYDAITRIPVAGAVVTIAGPAGFNPATDLVGSSASVTTGASGFYQFLLNPTAPTGTYTLAVTTYPVGYVPSPSALIPACANSVTVSGLPDPALIQTQATAPAATNTAHLPASCPTSTAMLAPANQGSTQYFMSFDITVPGSANVVNNHIPLDPFGQSVLVISKTGSASAVELGDSLQYTVVVRNVTAASMAAATVSDNLPAGFRYIAGTSTVGGAAQADPAGGAGPALTFSLGTLAPNSSTTVSYRVRVGVGAQQGDGINRAQAFSGVFSSNIAQWKVRVTGGVFSSEGCVVGKVFVDCNGNHVQDKEELGIPGVRMYFQNGSYLVSDSEGKYSACNLAPRTHVLKLDKSTLPTGARLTTSSNRNAGDAGSLFVDLTMGEMQRADFIEGSCSNPVLEQVKARRGQGGASVPQTEKRPAAALRFESKPALEPRQATDSANQPAEKLRNLVAPSTGASK